METSAYPHLPPRHFYRWTPCRDHNMWLLFLCFVVKFLAVALSGPVESVKGFNFVILWVKVCLHCLVNWSKASQSKILKQQKCHDKIIFSDNTNILWVLWLILISSQSYHTHVIDSLTYIIAMCSWSYYCS